MVFSLVGENRLDRWTDQMLNATLAIRKFGGSLADAPVLIGVVDGVRRDIRRALEAQGATVRPVPAVNREYRYANKLRMLELPLEHEADVIVCLDVDILVLGDMAPFLPMDAVGARTAGVDRWPEELWTRLFERFGLPVPEDRHVLLTGQRSFRYANTGVLTIPWRLRAQVRQRWQHYIEQLWEVGDLLPRKFLADQYALVFALYESGIPFEYLPPHLNLEPGVTPESYGEHVRDQFRPPYVVHYHKHLDEDGGVLPPKWPEAAELVHRFNACRAAIDRPARPLSERVPGSLSNSRLYRLVRRARRRVAHHR